LVSPSLAGLIEPGDYDVVHVNSEFSDQASDHDPQLARFLLNDAPEVTIGGPFTVAEGSELPVTAVGTDTEDETTLTYAWDLDGNGTFETPGQSPTFSAAGLDGPSTQAIAVQVTDDGGLTATQTTDVTIENVAPTPAIAGAPATSAEGSQITTTATSTDPGPDTVSYAWAVAKDGASFASGTGDSFSYTPDDNGTYVVELTATDDDGGSGTTTATTDVTNVNPVASLAGAAATSPEGTAVTATGSSTDAGSADTVVYAWSVTKDGAPFASGDGASVSYSPTDNGTYVVTLTATDDDGGSGTSSATTTVTNVAPTATFSAPARADAGSTYTIALNGPSDPSTVDVAHGLEYAFDCGTGYGAFGAASSQTCTADTLGSRTVGGKIRDKDGGVSTYSATVEVTITAQGLCQLTLQYIQASPKYQSLPAAARKVAEALAQAACGKLAVVPPMTEAHKAAAVNAYRHAVDALVPAGWLTAAQAAALGRWAAGI
ncbi:MAG: large repetitive protein, partial [Streptomyces sp.]|nr:large repetitive protein [Streptomyces sp.]